MRTAPSLTRVPGFPVVSGLAAMAAFVTMFSISGRSIDPFVMSSLAFESEPWRLVTCALPHGGVFHLIFNVYWLWVFGTQLEETLGSVSTFAIVIVLAAGSAAAEYGLLVGGIGLSGIVYGLFGFVLVMSRLDRRFRDGIDARVTVLFAIWGVFCVITTVLDVWRVANIAHGTGFVFGVLIAGVLAPWARWRRLAAAAVLVLTLAACLGIASLWRAQLNLSSAGGADDAYRGWVALDEGRTADAIRHLERALEVSPDDADSWFNYGLALARAAPEGSRTAALTAYRRALALDPTNSRTRQVIASDELAAGYEAQLRGDHTAAVELYRASIATQETAMAQWNLAISHDELGQTEDANRARARALTLDPKVGAPVDLSP
ncbi:MAG: rhomboid family intramembrane serine protease [Deltaproteobacteria bacterium]|nr:rhomboid family intramembrane serine protease [Deltaproteobacteria bacterium]